MDAVTITPTPVNEPVGSFAPGSPERARLQAKLTELGSTPTEIHHVIGGQHRRSSGRPVNVVQPHRHAAVLGTFTNADADDIRDAVTAADKAAPQWRALPFEERAAVFLRAADLLSGPWRETLAAATMLGQSKTAYQAEIDTPCELIDFWRFNVHFARQILTEQPVSSPGVWNKVEYRPLEGFIYAITPFNFTAIAGNLPTAPALMGNTVVWKPSDTQAVAAYWTMKLLEAAGLPPGVINLVTGLVPLSPTSCWPTPAWPGSTSPGRPEPSSICGSRSATISPVTTPTPGWSAKPAARTSFWRTAPPIPTC